MVQGQWIYLVNVVVVNNRESESKKENKQLSVGDDLVVDSGNDSWQIIC